MQLLQRHWVEKARSFSATYLAAERYVLEASFPVDLLLP